MKEHPLLKCLDGVGWQHPAFAPYCPLLRRLRRLLTDNAAQWRLSRSDDASADGLACWDAHYWLSGMNRLAKWRGLRSASGVPLRFVGGSDVGAVDYEQSVLWEGRIHCKLSAGGARHDFHNALVWLRFPRIKAAINWLHCQPPEALGGSGCADAGGLSGAAGQRSALRDMLTLLDENGAIWPDPQPLWTKLLTGHAWQALLVDLRNELLLSAHTPIVIGHGLLEKLHAPYKSMTAKLFPFPVSRYAVDRGVADYLRRLAGQPRGLRTGLMLPLPIQGWPGWDPANKDPGFYSDEEVFRPRRTAVSSR